MLAQRLAHLSHRQRLVVVGGLLCIALVVTGATALVVAAPGAGSTMGGHGPHPTAAQMQPLTLHALTVLPQSAPTPGTWGAAAPPFAASIAIAPSAPATLMACGSDGGMAALALSHDAGQTWAAYRSNVAAQSCAVSISAANPQMAALAVRPCAATCPAALYRTSDGGTTWAQAQLPDGVGFGSVLGWAGIVLYVSTDDTAHPLAVSVNGGAFVLRNDIARYPGQIAAIGASADTVFVTLTQTPPPATPAVPAAPMVVQSVTDGAVWSLTMLSDPPFTPSFAGTSADGAAILALVDPSTLAVSRDGGASWTSLAAFPGSMTLAPARFVARAPDGSVVVLLQSVSDASRTEIATLRAGDSAWAAAAALPAGAHDFALSWDAAGHLVALWATANGHLISDHF